MGQKILENNYLNSHDPQYKAIKILTKAKL